MNTPKSITIITVVKNAAQLLEDTILSVMEVKSTFRLKYVIIDGGSEDHTVDIIKKYEDKLSYWTSEQDFGIYDAMNKGWRAVAPDSFILFLGAGDRLISLPDDMGTFQYNNVIYGDVLIGNNTKFKAKAGYRLRLYNSLHHQALLINKSLHPSAPFNTNYSVFADFDFNQRLMKNGVQFVYSPQLLAYAHPGGVSDKNSFNESIRVIKKNFGRLWALLALGAYYTMKTIPFLRLLRPFQKT